MERETMTPRERVNRALRHEVTDRVPIDLGGNQTIMIGDNIQGEVPPENVVAMFDAAYECGFY